MWRVGQRTGRVIYGGPGDDDVIGYMDSRELAAEVVADHNHIATGRRRSGVVTNYLDTIAREIYCRTTPLTDEWDCSAEQGLYRIYAVLALGKGTIVTNEDVHNAWAAWAATMYSEHRSLVPYRELSVDVQALDDPYTAVIRAVARKLC